MPPNNFTVDDVRQGLDAGEFFLLYMPTMDLATGKCVGAEALARWQRPGGIVPPGEFVPLIEQTAVGGLLTYWVIETVAREFGDYLRQNPEFHLGINVPPEILGRGGLEYVGRHAHIVDVSRQFILEVTERGLPDQQGLDSLVSVSKRGVRIALDDVTLNGIKLALFSRGHIDIVKLDRSLINRITPDEPHPEWLDSVTALVRLGAIEVIAEGVETEEHLKALRLAGVPLAQGYYFSKPIGADALKEFRARRSSASQ